MTDTLVTRMWQWTKDKLRLGYGILVESGRRYGEYRVNRMSAAVAYRAMFAIAPLILIATWVFGLIIGTEEAQTSLYSAIADFAGEQVAELVEQLVVSAATGATAAAIIGFGLFLWTASSLFLELQRDLNDIFDVPSDYQSGVVAYVVQRGLGFLSTLAVGLLLIVIWALNLIWSLFDELFAGRGLGVLHDIIGAVAPIVSLILMPILFAVLLQSFVRLRISKRALYLGSIFTSVIFVISTFGVSLYFQWDANTTATEVAGAVFVILFAAFLLSSVFLYGAIVTRVYEHFLNTGNLRPDGPPEPEVVVGQPEPALPLATLAGFLGGLLVAWRRKQ